MVSIAHTALLRGWRIRLLGVAPVWVVSRGAVTTILAVICLRVSDEVVGRKYRGVELG